MARPITLHIETGPGGWLKAFFRRPGDEADNVVFCRFRAPKSTREGWALVGLHASKDSRPPWLSFDLLDAVPRHRIELAVQASDVFRTGLRGDLEKPYDPDDLDASFEKRYSTAPRKPLERPRRGELDDDFFRNVAMRYRFAVAGGHAPLETLAVDSGIPRGTIARWVAGARERGFLPAATPGRVSV